MPGTVFISYRRTESSKDARALYERLRAEFGTDRIFIDLEGLEPGDDFVAKLEQQLVGCQVMLALIAHDWVGKLPGGGTRLEDEKDFVRVEISFALSREIRTIPILLDGASLPRREDLPEVLQPLLTRQTVKLDFAHFEAGISRLLPVIRKVLGAVQNASTQEVGAGSKSGETATPGDSGAQSARQQAEVLNGRGGSSPSQATSAPGRAAEEAADVGAGIGRGGIPWQRKALWVGPALVLAVVGVVYLGSGPSSTATRPVEAVRPTTVMASAPSGAAAPLGAPASAPRPWVPPLEALERITHVVVIYAEGRSFDHLFGLYPGADGLARAQANQTTQLGTDEKVLSELVFFDRSGKPNEQTPRLPNKPFRIDAPPMGRGIDEVLPSPSVEFFSHQEQINGGRNNRFAALSRTGGWSMGHFDGSRLKLWKWAREYTLADHFFMGTFGGSYLNHIYLACACVPRFPDAPQSVRPSLDAQGRLVLRSDSPAAGVGAVKFQSTGSVTPDGWSVNTTQPPYQPSAVLPAPGSSPYLANPVGTAAMQVLPPQTSPTIGDNLSARDVSWAWYAGGWDAASAESRLPPSVPRRFVYKADQQDTPNFQPHLQPFNYFGSFTPGSRARAEHLKDGDEFLRDIDSRRLPAVSFYKPEGRFTQHPAYTDLKSGDDHIDEVLSRLRKSAYWPGLLVVVTYSNHGGYWDHAPPPSGPGWADRFGPGTRVPAVLIGPHVRKGFIDHTVYDTGSILKLLIRRYGLELMPGLREKTGDLTAALTS